MINSIKNREESIITLFFLIYFFIGLIIFTDYGISWDEPISRYNGFVSLNYLHELLGIEKYSNFQDIRTYRDNYYGVVFDMPMAFIEKLLAIISTKNYYHLRHFFNFIIFFISSIYFYLILNKFYKFNLVLIGLLIYISMPRIFAESFYNNKDLIFLSFFTITSYYLFVFFEKKNLINTFKLSLFIGLLIGTRIIGIIIPLLLIFYLTLESLDKKRNFLKLSRTYFLLIFFTIIFILIFWPFLWINPFENFLFSFEQMKNFKWSGSVFYLGKYEVGKFMPWHYSIMMIISTTPILYIIFFLIGYVATLKEMLFNFIHLTKYNGNLWKNNYQFANQLCFLIISLTIISIIEFDSTIYGGWRQIYYLYFPIAFLSIYGISIIEKKFKLVTKILIPIYLCLVIGWVILNHPYQYVYYNYPFSKFSKKNFEFDYWGVSNYRILDYIKNNYDRKIYKVFVFSVSPYKQSTLLFKDGDKSKFLFTNNENEAEFIVTNHYYEKKNPAEMRLFLKKKYRPVYEIKVNNIIINSLYEKRK